MSRTPPLSDVLATLDRRYPPGDAEEWDAVGLVCGDPDQPVRTVLFAVDPLPAVAAEAIDAGADLLVTHHPLFLTPVNGVPATGWKGRVVHDLIGAGVALFTAHTNADVAVGGVSDALAQALGLRVTGPLRQLPAGPRDKLVTFVPVSHTGAVVEALTAAGAGTIGDYTGCAWTTAGEGRFLPGPGTRPAVGAPGVVERVTETRVEMVLPRRLRDDVVRALRAAHPYEEVAFDLYELVAPTGPAGLGRVGALPASVALGQFAGHVASSLPATPAGVRFFGDPARQISTVAVCGGAGDGLLSDAMAAGVDAFVTADLRHHPASEHLATGGPVLIDPGHWASEWPWLPVASQRLVAELSSAGTTVEAHVSRLVTEPVSGHVPSRPQEDR